MAVPETPQCWLCVQGRAGDSLGHPQSHQREPWCQARTVPSASHLQFRLQTFGCSKSKWPSPPKEPLEIAISSPALSIHLNHGSEHYTVLKSQLPGPDCTQDKIIKGFSQHLTPQLITSKSNCKIKIKYCFYQKSPTQNFLCQPKELKHPEPSIDIFKAENELSANDSWLTSVCTLP